MSVQVTSMLEILRENSPTTSAHVLSSAGEAAPSLDRGLRSTPSRGGSRVGCCTVCLSPFFFQHKTIYFRIILDLQENCEDSTKRCCKPLLQSPPPVKIVPHLGVFVTTKAHSLFCFTCFPSSVLSLPGSSPGHRVAVRSLAHPASSGQ